MRDNFDKYNMVNIIFKGLGQHCVLIGQCQEGLHVEGDTGMTSVMDRSLPCELRQRNYFH